MAWQFKEKDKLDPPIKIILADGVFFNAESLSILA
jgi:hypothetical protein